MTRWPLTLALTALLLGVIGARPGAQQPAETPTPIALVPTNHPRVPSDITLLWMAPSRSHVHTAVMTEFASAVTLEVDGNFAKALPIFAKPALQQGPLGYYGQYYEGLAELRTGHAATARDTFRALQARDPVGYLVEGAALREAEADEALNDFASAAQVYDRLSQLKTTAPEDVLLRLGRAARAAGDADKALAAFSRVYYEYPFSDASISAGDELDRLGNVPPMSSGSARYKLELGRAERLFGAKKYPQARSGFEALRRGASGDDKELVDLRIAECDYFLKRARSARDALKPYIEKASRQGEALYFYAVASRELGDVAEYTHLVRRLVEQFSQQTWAEEALNNLATHYILDDDDQEADATFREMYQKFPMGRYAERAAWKIGWSAYKAGRYAEAAQVFEGASAHFPRSDYRPPWLYWSARAHEALGERSVAEGRYRLVASDYLNTYYGRLAAAHLDAVPERQLIVDAENAAAAAADDPPMAAPPPPNAPVVRALLGLELYDQAIDELHFAQKNWGDSSPIQATLGWIYHERGDLRAGINAMKRAYPQYMAAGGEKLPTELLKVLFPINYWPLIKRYSELHHVDPYLMAALCLQESNFEADVRSAANAYGVMQLLPSTGRQYAKLLHLPRRFTLSMLTTAETNINMGTAHFADLVKQFGGTHFALASYNAGESRVVRWIAERPGVSQEQFIDDIPFPETQNYVKKILGIAEDYRKLYGGEGLRADAADAADPKPASNVAPKAAAPNKAGTKSSSTTKRAAAKKRKTG